MFECFTKIQIQGREVPDMACNVCWMKSWRVSRGVVSPDRGTKTVD